MSNIVKFSELEEKILELYTKGYTKEAIAIELELPINEINKVFRKPQIKEKMAEIIELRELLLKEKQLGILETITQEMIQEAIEKGDFKSLLNKNRDILDVISLTSQVTKEIEKKRLGTSEQNVIVQILNQLSGDDDD